jgi:hypothetical protein
MSAPALASISSRRASTSALAEAGGGAQGRGGRIDRAVEALLERGLFPHRRQIVLHAHQGIGADGLDPRLLQGVIDQGALGGLRLVTQVRGRVVVRDPQGHLVGEAADAGGLRSGKLARRMRQDRPMPDQRRPVAGKHHLQVRLLRQRPRGMGQRALEDLGGGFLAAHCGVVLARGRE